MEMENLLDPELQTVMGPGRCKDLTAEKNTRKTVTKDQPVDATWAPARKDPNAMERLKKSAVCALTFGGLAALFFTWQQVGLMDPKAAVPSMLTCAVLVGLGIGRNTVR